MTTLPHRVSLESLEISDFRGFPETQALQLDGQHLLLYGENGSGKTSIFQAIAELLQLSPDATPYGSEGRSKTLIQTSSTREKFR